MNYNTNLQQNNAKLQEILRKANALPEAGEGGETPVEPVLQEKTVTPTKSKQIVVPDGDYDGLSQVTVEQIPNEYIVPSGSQKITANGSYDVTDKAGVEVYIPERKITLQDKTITTNGSYSADDGYDGLGEVNVNVPIPDGYIKPSGTLEVTENGEYDVTEKEKVVVDVEQGGETVETCTLTLLNYWREAEFFPFSRYIAYMDGSMKTVFVELPVLNPGESERIHTFTIAKGTPVISVMGFNNIDGGVGEKVGDESLSYFFTAVGDVSAEIGV